MKILLWITFCAAVIWIYLWLGDREHRKTHGE